MSLGVNNLLFLSVKIFLLSLSSFSYNCVSICKLNTCTSTRKRKWWWWLTERFTLIPFFINFHSMLHFVFTLHILFEYIFSLSLSLSLSIPCLLFCFTCSSVTFSSIKKFNFRHFHLPWIWHSTLDWFYDARRKRKFHSISNSKWIKWVRSNIKLLHSFITWYNGFYWVT